MVFCTELQLNIQEEMVNDKDNIAQRRNEKNTPEEMMAKIFDESLETTTVPAKGPSDLSICQLSPNNNNSKYEAKVYK